MWLPKISLPVPIMQEGTVNDHQREGEMTNGNDPAFPADTFAVHKDLPRDVILKLSQCQGMTIRTWLAGMALNAVIGGSKVGEWYTSEVVECAVKMADALLAELGKQK
jgi:hypothetical protein